MLWRAVVSPTHTCGLTPVALFQWVLRYGKRVAACKDQLEESWGFQLVLHIPVALKSPTDNSLCLRAVLQLGQALYLKHPSKRGPVTCSPREGSGKKPAAVWEQASKRDALNGRVSIRVNKERSNYVTSRECWQPWNAERKPNQSTDNDMGLTTY